MKFKALTLAVAVIGGGLFTTAATAGTIADEVIAASSLEGFDTNGRDYDILLQAVIAADLVDALSDPNAALTVFAPNDRAFIRLAQDLGYEGNDEEGAFGAIAAFLADENGDPIPALTNVLLYHVAPGEITAIDFILRSFFRVPIDTLQTGQIRPFFFTLIDNNDALRNPRLTFPLNLNTDNGIIHTINRVLLP